jgi:hypothetical protein
MRAMTVIYPALAICLVILLPAYLAGRLARRKGRPFALYFVAGLVLGPLALLIALLLPRRRIV